jgi:hypothetical protein
MHPVLGAPARRICEQIESEGNPGSPITEGPLHVPPGLLRYGFVIANPWNDAISDDSRDGHLPCEE